MAVTPELDRPQVLGLVVHPTTVPVELRPIPRGVSPDALGFLWHRVVGPQGAKVSITSTDSKYRVLHLSVRSGDPQFRNKWIKWSYSKRRATEAMGGDAVDAVDQLSANDQELTILVAPGETRTVEFEITATLDGETPTGKIPVVVVAQDVDDPSTSALEFFLTLDLRHPTANFLDLLPSLYRDAMADLQDLDPDAGPPFFERYLRGFEDCIQPLRQTLDQMDRLFSPLSCPSPFVAWLGAWVSMPDFESWPEMRRRRLVLEAVELYRWRGTKRGLSRYLTLYTGYEPVIDDQPVEGWRLGPHALLGTDQTVLGDVPPHTFVVTIGVPDPSLLNPQIINDIIRWEKPAHTAFTLNIVQREAHP